MAASFAAFALAISSSFSALAASLAAFSSSRRRAFSALAASFASFAACAACALASFSASFAASTLRFLLVVVVVAFGPKFEFVKSIVATARVGDLDARVGDGIACALVVSTIPERSRDGEDIAVRCDVRV